jgi:tetratricopeptide (TPR) repeat protein
VAGNIALTLTTLGDVSQKLGDFNRAQTQYLRAIDLWRSAGDKRGVATSSFAMGTLLEQQGKYGAALEAKQQAVKTFVDLQERSPTFAEMLIGYGSSLSMLGRSDEAEKQFEQALVISRELKNEGLIAEAINAQGDNAFYRGDLKRARELFGQAEQAAARSGTRYDALVARVNSAKVGVEEGRGNAAEIKKLMAEADSLGLKQVSAQCSLYLGRASLRSKNASAAIAPLQEALSKADRLGAKPLQARAHGSLAEAYSATGKAADAATHQRQMKDLLGEMRTESRSDALLARYDFKNLGTD